MQSKRHSLLLTAHGTQSTQGEGEGERKRGKQNEEMGRKRGSLSHRRQWRSNG